MGERNPIYKVCLIGPSQSGKTHFMNKLIGRNGRMGFVDRMLNQAENYEDYSTTLGVVLDIVERQECTINFWDTGSIKVSLGDGHRYASKCDGFLQFHDEDDNPPPFEPPQDVPIVHVYDGDDGNIFLQSLIDMMNE